MKSKSRLASLMFFQLFVVGAYSPLLSMYMTQYLGFNGSQTGLVLACAVFSSILAPLISVYVVDRLIGAKQLYIVFQVFIAFSTLGLFFARSFPAFLSFYVLNTLCTSPSFAMLMGITFQSLHDSPKGSKGYGGIRVWGTIGWIASAWLVSSLWFLAPLAFPTINRTDLAAGIFLLASLGSSICIIVALNLKNSRPTLVRQKVKPELIPRESLAVLLRPDTLVLSALYLLSSIIDKFYSFGLGPFLVKAGYRSEIVPSLLTLGQVSEVIMLFTLGALVTRFSTKTLLVCGTLAQLTRMLLFALGNPFGTIFALFLHGLVFALVYSVIVMYLDKHAKASSRQGLHQLIALFFGAGSTLIGNLLAGFLVDLFGGKSAIDYSLFWLVPAAFAGFTIILSVVFFRETKSQEMIDSTDQSNAPCLDDGCTNNGAIERI